MNTLSLYNNPHPHIVQYTLKTITTFSEVNSGEKYMNTQAYFIRYIWEAFSAIYFSFYIFEKSVEKYLQQM